MYKDRSGSPRRCSRSKSYSRSFSRSRSPEVRHKRRRSRSRSHSRTRYLPPRFRSRDQRESVPPSKCVGVFGLSLKTQEREIYDLFCGFGSVEDVNVVFDNYTGKSRGFAFVYFKHLSDAKHAKEELHGTELDGRVIRTDYSFTNGAHSPTPGVYMGRHDRRGGRRRRSRSPRGRYSRSRS